MRYIYGLKMRPFSPGAQPKEGFLYANEESKLAKYGIVCYDRELSEQEVDEYELVDFKKQQAISDEIGHLRAAVIMVKRGIMKKNDLAEPWRRCLEVGVSVSELHKVYNEAMSG